MKWRRDRQKVEKRARGLLVCQVSECNSRCGTISTRWRIYRFWWRGQFGGTVYISVWSRNMIRCTRNFDWLWYTTFLLFPDKWFYIFDIFFRNFFIIFYIYRKSKMRIQADIRKTFKNCFWKDKTRKKKIISNLYFTKRQISSFILTSSIIPISGKKC